MSVLIIAEAGVNHNGSLETAKKLVDAAKESGADCIKFQTFKSENLVVKQADKADYQKENTSSSESQLEMLQKLELSYDDFIDLNKYCEMKNIVFLSTPFDLESIDFLNSLGMNRWKIPSGEITNLPYLIKLAQTKKPIILSTGMCTLAEVKAAFELLKANGSCDITILHCTTDYPTSFADVNLNAMITLKNQFQVPVGYSDHTEGIEIPIAAVAMGASVIEKHFTLDREMEGPDHKASLAPYELRAMVKAIRNVELALGSGIKKPADSEIKNRLIVRKSIIASQMIKKGELFTDENLAVKRPGNGICPMKWFEVLGKRAVKDFKEDELIEL